MIPIAIRQKLGWTAGTEVVIESHNQGVVVRAVRELPVTQPEDLLGCVNYRGPRLSLADMQRVIDAEARRRR